MLGENIMSPAVAPTDNAKPQETASSGAKTMSRAIEMASTATPLRCPPLNIPTKTTAAMTAARSTLG